MRVVSVFVFEGYIHRKNCLVLFLGQYSVTARPGISSQIQNAYQDHLTPECVIFLYPGYLCKEVDELLLDDGFQVDLKRHKHSPIICVNFDETGEFHIGKTFHDDGSLAKSLDRDQLSRDVVKAGYSNLMELRASDVLVKSPAGTIFVKPSGQELEEFIYASQLARNNSEYQFLAMSLLRHVPSENDIDSIYIDTSSIAAIAEAVTYYFSKFKQDTCKQISYQSFSSYSGMEVGRPDNVDGVWVIISASASTSMGKEIVKEWNLSPKQVVTILSYRPLLKNSDKNIGNTVVFSVNEYSNRDTSGFAPTKVQVQGESFSAEVSQPDKILLGLNHKPAYLDKAIFSYRENEVFSVNRKPISLYVEYAKLRQKYLNGNDVIGGELFNWMQQIVTWAIPRNLKAIVIDGGKSNGALLEDFKRALRVNDFDTGNLSILNGEQNKELSGLKNGAVLVLAAALSSGHYFIDINRSLRLAGHSGMRVFVTPFMVSTDTKQFDQFKTSLTQGFNGFKYLYFNYRMILIGDKLKTTWEYEKEVITKLINESEDLEGMDYWIARKSQLDRTGQGLFGNIGLHYNDVGRKFDFTKDFVFWPGTYNCNKVDSEAVYATVAGVLQNAREKVVKGAILSSNIYKHSVIDPENFVRFNDPLLQSCIWRCAKPSELDFRRSDVLSTDVQRIMSKIFLSCESPRGQVSLDLLMAISIRWIKVSPNSLEKIVKEAELYLVEPHAQILVGYMKKEFGIS
jgi:hypothetical protein